MDIFRILSRGASIPKKNKESVDYALPSSAQVTDHKKKQENLQGQIEREIDFFHTKKSNKTANEEEKPEVGKVEAEEKYTLKIRTQTEADSFRTLNKTKVSGDGIPLPVGSFEDLVSRFKLDKRILSNMIESDFIEPTPIQCESIPISLEGRDLLACAPTGSGKTLAYLIPLIQKLVSNRTDSSHRGISSLIIAPTNELANQIFRELEVLIRGKKLEAAVLSKKLANKLTNNIVNSSKYDILVATPLRLIDTIKQDGVDLSKVEELVIDEADKLFEQGFIDQTDEILSHCTSKSIRKSMFSATIPSGVEEIAHSIMVDPIRIVVGLKEAASNTIDQSLVFTGNEEGKLVAIKQLIQNGEFKPPVIIFLQSISRAKALFHELLYDKLNVDVIHAERTPKQRDEVIKRFRSGSVWVLITTDVLARGVDFKGVNLVINYDVPQSAQAYVHRIGRTGRGGKAGKAITFFTKEDNLSIKPIINVMKQSGCNKGYSEWMENMTKLSKNEKKSIKKHEIKRKYITTTPKVIRQKRRQREEMIDASKRRKDAVNTSDE